MSTGMSPGADTEITGATDGTNIGNVGNRLRVTNAVASDAPGAPVFTKKYRVAYDGTDVSLTTTLTNIFTYTGSGKFVSFVMSTDKSTVLITLKIDSDAVFTDLPVSGIATLDIKGTLREGADASGDGKKFIFARVIEYGTDIVIDAKTSSGTAKVLDHVVELTKET